MLYVRTLSPPDWGHRGITSVSLCIIAFSLPPSDLYDTWPPSLFIKMSSCYCLLASKQTKLALGPEQVAAACTQNLSRFPVMSCISFPFCWTSFWSVKNRECVILGENTISPKWWDPAEWHLAHVCLVLDVHWGAGMSQCYYSSQERGFY